MSRLLRPRPKDLPYVEEVRADRHTLQKGSLNDPAQQAGRLYLNKAHTAYLYLEDNDLYFQAPDGGTPTKLT